jgi:hypothetical protein
MKKSTARGRFDSHIALRSAAGVVWAPAAKGSERPVGVLR